MKYRKLPVEVDAIQFIITDVIPCKYGNAKRINSMEVCKFMGLPMLGTHTDKKGSYINIDTLEGVMRADINDYIVKGVKGEFYPCKPDIFELTYEPVK